MYTPSKCKYDQTELRLIVNLACLVCPKCFHGYTYDELVQAEGSM